jgi:tetratricopeptide (TPR) repeat protein
MTAPNTNADQLFEVGQLLCDRGDFIKAIEKFQDAAVAFREKPEIEKYLKTLNLLLRLFAEREQFEEITATKEILQDLVLKEGFELNSKTYYTLALCASYKGQFDVSLDYLQKALALALATDNKEDICYAICGTASTYAMMGRNEECLKEIYNLQIFFQVLDVPEIKISTQILNAFVLREMKKFDQAIEVLWQAYEFVKTQKTMSMHIYLMFNLGRTYLEMGEKDMARLYLNLAYRSIDPENMVHLAGEINQYLNKLGDDPKGAYDLVFELENHAIIERKLGRVDFKNQFILLDLLRLFCLNQGQVYSKEYLVETVWKQPYDPAVHDNKIYVTIKRLRKLIEPDYDRPKYIFRAKNGYFMNKSAKILLEQKGGEQ